MKQAKKSQSAFDLSSEASLSAIFVAVAILFVAIALYGHWVVGKPQRVVSKISQQGAVASKSGPNFMPFDTLGRPLFPNQIKEGTKLGVTPAFMRQSGPNGQVPYDDMPEDSEGRPIFDTDGR